jgi:hypothetical protein
MTPFVPSFDTNTEALAGVGRPAASRHFRDHVRNSFGPRGPRSRPTPTGGELREAVSRVSCSSAVRDIQRRQCLGVRMPWLRIAGQRYLVGHRQRPRRHRPVDAEAIDRRSGGFWDRCCWCKLAWALTAGYSKQLRTKP